MPSNLFENGYHAGANKIRKDHKNILNRLRSIDEDAAFVKEIASLFPKLPLVANERCGSWYLNPIERQVHSVYFKSTDGHMGQWDFNLRRSNLHLLDVIHAHEGCIIVDSTRKGKRIPDSLAKTIPIWCSTLNRAVAKYRKDSDWDTSFYSLPSVVSRSEHAQIESRIDGFAQRLLDSKAVDMKHIAGVLRKPLRPIWLTPQSTLLINDPPDYSDVPFWPVICLSASQAVESGSQVRPGYLYVQGSGDDQEAWCMGLTPKIFWKHHDELVNSPTSAECEKRVRQLVKDEKEAAEADDDDVPDDNASMPFNFIENTTIAIGSRLSGKPPACWEQFDVVINCMQLEYEENKNECYKSRYLQLPIPEGKKGQNAFFESIPVALEFVKAYLAEQRKILIHCAKGQDRSVGIALAILVKYFNEQNELCLEGEQKVDKPRIQHHLMRIISSHPKASPSRATLKKINLYFMSKEDEC